MIRNPAPGDDATGRGTMPRREQRAAAASYPARTASALRDYAHAAGLTIAEEWAPNRHTAVAAREHARLASLAVAAGWALRHDPAIAARERAHPTGGPADPRGRRPATAGEVRRRRPAGPLALAALAALLGCGGSEPTPPEPPGGDGDPPAAIRLVEVAAGLASPVHLTSPPGDDRLFVVERPGRIRIIEDGELLPTPFLDIVSNVGSSGSEQGLLSVAFHPQYASNGFFYVNYTDRDGNTRVERYTVSAADPNRADPASAKLILGVDQPYSNHNGGLLLFGPDRMLYIGMGDGGAGGDPHGNGQNKGTLLGALLRIDVDGGDPYAIPPDNPYVGEPGARGEIWAIGLRNPWRFAFDPPTNRLYVADVGQNRYEEIDVVDARTPGLNYGWNIMEGAHCYPTGPCESEGLVLPVLEYTHDDGCSVTGGAVYRGDAIPGLVGHYFYADYCAGWIRSFRYEDGRVTDAREWPVGSVGNILSFGQDAAGELYVLSANGRVYRIEAD
ncbi:MAG TPA: PQQ-dependent sugar dehydrogenase [Longimicrobiales bacterium]